ncbi:MAG: c-type cytochrome [Desulfatiglandaceae bacterium]|jgi:cytochrome c551/c552
MRKLILIVIVGLVFLAVNVAAEEGDSIFKSHHCGICHKLDTGKANPSLREIAQSYQGKEERLISFFKGESESIIRPEKGMAMKRYIEKTKALSDSDRKALADYLLSHKE